MKAFFLRHKKLHLWLLADALALAAFFALRPVRPAMAWLHDTMAAFRRGVGRLCYRTEISVAEVLCVLLAVFAVLYITSSIVKIVRSKGNRLRCAYGVVLLALCIGGSIYGGMCYLWGVTYYVPGFQERSGIYAREVATEDLQAVTDYFVQQLNDTADAVSRDENGLFAVPQTEIFDGSVQVYDGVEEAFPFLAFDDQPPKAVRFSRIMSRLDFTGVYCPFTGESNVNVDCPTALLPSTIAHELAHQRGVASEQECNFLAILASTTSGSNAYAYSGWLLGYIHLGNALYSADPAAWEQVYGALPEGVKADLTANNQYWAQFRNTAVKKVSNTVYDQFLKGYGEENGIRSYGTVVDMLVAYYAPQL